MSGRTLSVGPAPQITVDSVGGDLSVVGWEGEQILIKADEDEVRLKQDGNLVSVSSQDDLSLRVPRGASVSIKSVSGDMALRGISGSVELGAVGGDLSMRDVGSVAISTIQSDFSLRDAKGSLSVQNIGGDVSVRNVDGSVELTSIADDLTLRDVRGNVNATVGGDVVLYLNPTSDQMYNVTAGDDILLVLPLTVNATLTLQADEIDIDWPGVKADEEATQRVLAFGNGAAKINLNAGSDIRVSSDVGAGESADEYGNFAGMMFDWSDFGQQLGDRISQRVENATRRATQQAERAARRAEQKVRNAHIRANVGVGRWNWNIEPGSFPPVPPREPVSEEERMAILKMLQEKKITAEEADKLLAALEGGE
ncbi:MAG TPA: hypothetical protein VMT73_00700 [Anaerolineales bacterium]|nr:hypothetical protein [Anaerolineales bacterium]